MGTLKSQTLITILTLITLLDGYAEAQNCAQDPLTHELLVTGDGFRALTRMKEFEFNHRSSDSGYSCGKRILHLYLSQEEYDGAEKWVDALAKNYTQLKIDQYLIWKMELAFLYKNYSEVLLRAEKVKNSEQKSQVVYFSQKLSPLNLRATDTCTTSACRQLDELLKDPQLNRRKSTTLATTLGIIPGLGQIYAGRTGAGVASFLTNALLASLAIYAFNRNENSTGILVSAVGAVTYVGSIYAGYEAAERFNERQRMRLEDKAFDIPLHLTLPVD